MRPFFLATERLFFSRWTNTDGNFAALLWGDSQVTKLISRTGQLSDQEITDKLAFEIATNEKHGIQYWPVFSKENNELVGCCGLHPYEDYQDIYEIGFHLRPAFWGKGLAIEAAQAVIEYAFNTLDARELFAGHNPDNIGSQKTLNKLGFEYIGDRFYAPTGLNHPSYQYTLVDR